MKVCDLGQAIYKVGNEDMLVNTKGGLYDVGIYLEGIH